MKNNKLPQGWQEVELGDVLNYEQPTDYIVESEEYSDEYKTPVLTAGKSLILGHTDETNGIYSKLPVIIFDDFTTANKFVTFPFKVKSSAMKLLTPRRKDVDLKFIFLLMQTIKTSSTTHKRYYLSSYSKIKILLPPPATQKAIVSILEKAEALKQKRGEADKLTKEYLQSVFYEMFDGKSNKIKLKELCLLITKGTTPTTYGHSFIDEGINFLKIENIDEDGNILMNSLQFISEEAHNLLKRSKLMDGDILFSIAGALGRVAIIKKEHLPANINQAIAIIRLKSEKDINKKYLEFYLKSDILIKQITENKRGVAQLNLNLEQVGNLDIILPPLPLQQKFASIVEHVEKLKEKQKKSKEEIDNLFNSLMQKAFNGELVE